MGAFQTSIIKVVTGIFTRTNQESKKIAHVKSDDFDTFLNRIKANTYRMKS